jgi:hypothetical protein
MSRSCAPPWVLRRGNEILIARSSGSRKILTVLRYDAERSRTGGPFGAEIGASLDSMTVDA